ncbi:MAG: hypothetical protein AUF76_11310 [Acidobacteria bacterium 13_1_20CM_2_65_9]|nr:MAG: hypothetical protein AUF76_11310 [Acidobacteria bacterium 13_1_20CM_2_65_9]
MLTALGYTIPLAFASGLNVYATVAVLGLCSHYGLVALPPQFRAFDNPIVITVALAMYLVEFVADKIPWLDSLWDMVHTVVRPIGGAIIAVTALGDASPTATTLAALLGGSVAMTTHLTKAGTRAAANTSPEPFSNWILSFGEDVLAVSISYGALRHPMLTLAIAVALLLVMLAFASILIRAVRRRFARAGRSG